MRVVIIGGTGHIGVSVDESPQRGSTAWHADAAAGLGEVTA